MARPSIMPNRAAARNYPVLRSATERYRMRAGGYSACEGGGCNSATATIWTTLSYSGERFFTDGWMGSTGVRPSRTPLGGAGGERRGVRGYAAGQQEFR